MKCEKYISIFLRSSSLPFLCWLILTNGFYFSKKLLFGHFWISIHYYGYDRCFKHLSYP